ncbi:MAG TPA: hypothetical protein VG965_02335 [Patescibacteria group bacterium]|nr:hypothetical protein [Patescibacteria group bacterium]
MRVNKGSIANALLFALEKSAEGLIILDSFSYSSQMRSIRGLPAHKDPTILETIRRLRRRGFIERETNQDGKVILRLTEIGRDYLGHEEEWDGVFRIVIWDVPESKRRIRNLFRRRLREWDFKIWQKSVWISKRNVTNQMRNLIAELEMGKYIAIIESNDPYISHIMMDDRSR